MDGWFFIFNLRVQLVTFAVQSFLSLSISLNNETVYSDMGKTIDLDQVGMKLVN